MALIAINAVVDIAANALVFLVGLRLSVTVRTLEDRVIVRIDMARGADAISIAVIDRERRVLRVIERSLQPVRCVMAGLAGRGEELRLSRMSGIRGGVVVGLVASDARRRQRGVVIVDVAIGAEPRW